VLGGRQWKKEILYRVKRIKSAKCQKATTFKLIQKLLFQYDANKRLSLVVFDAFMKKAYSDLMQNIEK